MYQPVSLYRELLALGLLLLAGWSLCELTDISKWLLAVILLGYMVWHLYHLWRLVRWLEDSANQLPPAARGVWGYVYYRLEVKRRKAAKRKKQIGKLLKQFQASTQALPDATVVLDKNFRIQWLNDATTNILGIQRSDTGQPVSNLLRDPKFMEYLQQGRFDNTLNLESPRDKRMRIFIRIVPFERKQFLLLARDVTQQHLLENMRRDFVSNASHELRTPLAVLQGSLEQLESEVDSNPVLARPVARMKRQSERMMRILQDLLTLARLESRRQPEGKHAVNLSSLVGEVVEEARLATKLQGGHDVRADIAPDIGLVGNPQDLHAAVSNLVMNAVRYTPPGGVISVTLAPVDNGVRFEVVDTGVGISPQHLQRLTERFYRVDVGRSRESGGTGLGLSIVKHILEQYGTQLDIASTPGAGSRFGFTLGRKHLCELGPQACNA
ncbi:MAG: phosphate regulon sensor histidine kinase PhoR [Pseudomonadota bacterium]